MSVVRLDRAEGRKLHIRDVDVVEGTPLLDIMPHFPELDLPVSDRFGWIEEKTDRIRQARDDGSFTEAGQGASRIHIQDGPSKACGQAL